ncbi:esterase E4-like [Pogonomyrmex barbatus]|uniref:Carboxylic ester hydrolase n=1 Tax=Pogonomyrmex barbatus TaxID=144034 RepID=A0A6I9VSK5_9HYME|nr:esterase E4-like [Pogonomyrmex barbatus]
MKGNPVMVWIHGGAYLEGNGNDAHYRPDYLMTKDVILVSINYRLGALGFLNLGHKVANGNQGLKDQIAALKWIKENIEAFGGDSNNITVFGASAGGSSAHFLMLSPLSKGLFQKAILQSGMSTCDWAIIKHSVAKAFKLASILGTNSKDPEEVVRFLQGKSAAEIVKAQYTVLTPEEVRIIFMPFGPSINDKAEKSVLPHPVSELINDDNNIPIMIGNSSYEYIFFLKDISQPTLNIMYADIPRYMENFINSQDSEKITQLTDRVKQHYFHNNPFTEENIPSIIQWLSDIHFKLPVKDFVNKRRKKDQASTYFYEFSYVGSQKTPTKLMHENDTINNLTSIGASHIDELAYLFYLPNCKTDDPPARDTKDRKILEILTKMWTNFAKTGNPTPVLDQYVTTTWLPATKDTFNCLNIGDTLQHVTVSEDNIL